MNALSQHADRRCTLTPIGAQPFAGMRGSGSICLAAGIRRSHPPLKQLFQMPARTGLAATYSYLNTRAGFARAARHTRLPITSQAIDNSSARLPINGNGVMRALSVKKFK